MVRLILLLAIIIIGTPSCLSTQLEDLKVKVNGIDLFLDGTRWEYDGALCDVSYRLCRLENKVPNKECWERLEECEIQAAERFEKVRRYKDE